MTHYVFDCDDVLLDWQGGFADYLRKRGLDVHVNGPAEWCLSHWIGCSPTAAKDWVQRYNASPDFGRMKPLADVYIAVWNIADLGHSIDILTACGDAQNTKSRRINNLAFIFDRAGELPYNFVTCLPLGMSKSDALIQQTAIMPVEHLVFVEDNYSHAKTGAELGIESYCLRRSHNRSDEAADKSDVIWIDQIAEVVL